MYRRQNNSHFILIPVDKYTPDLQFEIVILCVLKFTNFFLKQYRKILRLFDNQFDNLFDKLHLLRLEIAVSALKLAALQENVF